MKQYIVDAFADRLFQGNQAAVCVLEEWLPEALMLGIARENNLSETAFTVRQGDTYRLRWFTPGGEIDLCGHATLASAFVLFQHYIPDNPQITFTTLSGDLIVTRHGDVLEMAFPAYALTQVPVTGAMSDAIGHTPKEAWLGRDLVCVFDDEAIVRQMQPDMTKVKQLDGLLLHVTAPGAQTDCVSRSFAPKLAVAEDPVCGSGHCHIAPFWAGRLGKRELVAYQASERGGTLYCRVEGDKVFLAGRAVLFAISELMI